MRADILKIAICDDEEQERAKLRSYIDEYMRQLCVDYTADEYASGEQLLDAGCLDYSLIFLDIFMDELNGIETSKRIAKNNKNVHIVFCSTSNEFAAQSYDVNAFYYITKPVDKNILFSVLERFIGVYYQTRSISVRVGRDTQSILITDIIYADAQGKKTRIHTKTGDIDASILLSELENMLSHSSFCKPIRYAIVSMDEIVQIPTDCLVLSDGSKIQISRSMRAQIKERFTQYKLDNMRRRILK